MLLHLADDLKMPVDLATQTTLVVGKRGSGKSNSCRRMAEQMFRAGVQFVAIDPTDTWYGLKSSRDGKSPGLGVYVLGGRHQDLPLESTGGALAADVIIDHGISAVLSIKHFSGRERGRFVSDFADRLFRRNTSPLHVFLEEAHEVAPQNPFKGDEEMLGRITRLWKLGRSSGIGGSAITQRPASLSKQITTQAEVLIVHRMLGPQDVAAVREWIRYHGEREDILAQLSTLKTGEAFVWAPDFPEEKPIGLRRVRMLASETFDSAATPKAGQRSAEPKALAPVDLKKLETAMAATIERARADDPKELRAEIAKLKRDLATAAKAPPAPAAPVKVPVLEGAELKRVEALVGKLNDVADTLAAEFGERLANAADEIEQQAKGLHAEAAVLRLAIARATAQPVSAARPTLPSRLSAAPASLPRRGGAAPPAAASRGASPANGHAEALTEGQQRIVDTIAMLMRREIQPSLECAAAWLDVHPRGGRFRGNWNMLHEQGYLDSGHYLTPLGQSVAVERWLGTDGVRSVLSEGQTRIFDVIEAGTPALEAVANQLGVHVRGGRFRGNYNRLCRMCVVDGRGLTDAAGR